MTDVETLMQDLERQSAERTAAIREMLYQKGRPDLVAELDAKLRDIRTGIAGAQSAWHSISDAQRYTLTMVAGIGSLWLRYDKRGYCLTPSGMGQRICGQPTARNLIARELLAPDGGAFDPEARLAITERGRFVLKHGRSTPPSN